MEKPTKEMGIIKSVLKIVGLAAFAGMLFYITHYGLTRFRHLLLLAVSRSGGFAPIVFILFQIFQVMVPVLPGGVSLSVGVLAFGTVWGFLYNYIGIVIGSICSFLLVRHFGKKFLLLLISEATYDKYVGYLGDQRRFTRIFLLCILLPVAPDDLMCMLAGLSQIKTRTFILIVVVCKPITIYLYGNGLTAILQFLFK